MHDGLFESDGGQTIRTWMPVEKRNNNNNKKNHSINQKPKIEQMLKKCHIILSNPSEYVFINVTFVTK